MDTLKTVLQNSFLEIRFVSNFQFSLNVFLEPFHQLNFICLAFPLVLSQTKVLSIPKHLKIESKIDIILRENQLKQIGRHLSCSKPRKFAYQKNSSLINMKIIERKTSITFLSFGTFEISVWCRSYHRSLKNIICNMNILQD